MTWTLVELVCEVSSRTGPRMNLPRALVFLGLRADVDFSIAFVAVKRIKSSASFSPDQKEAILNIESHQLKFTISTR